MDQDHGQWKVEVKIQAGCQEIIDIYQSDINFQVAELFQKFQMTGETFEACF